MKPKIKRKKKGDPCGFCGKPLLSGGICDKPGCWYKGTKQSIQVSK